jgi:Asp-tRNA(Asn)/Glu-tRNA(Gln) amidotransferase A subunit family amidase
VNAVMRDAINHMTRLGATVLPVGIPGLVEMTTDLSLMSLEFAAALGGYLARLGPRAPVKTLAALVARGECHPALRPGLAADARVVDGPASAELGRRLARREALRTAVLDVMDAKQLDALLYPHQRRLVVPVGEEQIERNGALAHGTGLPAVTFPGGFSAPTASAPLGVPVGLELLGRDWAEGRLLSFAYAYELVVRPRRAPGATPLVDP